MLGMHKTDLRNIMMCVLKKGEENMEITKDIRYVGVNDHDIDLFEGQYVVLEAMAYNSHVIVDE